VTDGEGFPWSRTTISTRTGGRIEHTWDFERGVLQPPVWLPDGDHLIVSSSDPKQAFPPIILLGRDGERRSIGNGSAPSGSPDGNVYAGKGDRIVRYGGDGSQSTVVRQSGFLLDQPLASPDGSQLVYTAARGNRLDFHLLELGSGHDRVLC